jgi:DNA (cytosine-5)-methyltransferase 1
MADGRGMRDRMGSYVFRLSNRGGCVVIVDLFAGPGGWSEGLRMLAPDLHATEIGLEWDAAACETRAAAGHATIRTDIAAYPTDVFDGKVTGLIASPPCQDFSLAGKRAGIEGERGQLIREVLRWSEALRPEWIACEQVPPALPVWRDYETELRKLGYYTWSGVLNAADYGVPQTRRRAILMASRTKPTGPPEPTHDREPMPSLFDDDLFPWVSMADALGWGRNRPAWTLACTNDTIGGSGVRAAIAKEQASGEWILNAGRTESQPNRALRPIDEPAPTLAFGHDSASWKWEYRSAIRTKHGFRVLDANDPAPYVKPNGPSARYDDVALIPVGENETNVLYDEALKRINAGNAQWFANRPATTLVGSFCPDIVADPGVDLTRPRQDRAGSVRISITDALVLQSFPPDYPLQGLKTKQFQQVGNAVPPRLAAHILAKLTGRKLEL